MSDADQLRSALELIRRVLWRHARQPERINADESALHDVLYAVVVLHARFARLRPDVRALAPEIPFDAVRAMRNIAVHEPDRIDVLIIVALVRVHLPRLVVDLDRLIDRLETSTAGD